MDTSQRMDEVFGLLSGVAASARKPQVSTRPRANAAASAAATAHGRTPCHVAGNRLLHRGKPGGFRGATEFLVALRPPLPDSEAGHAHRDTHSATLCPPCHTRRPLHNGSLSHARAIWQVGAAARELARGLRSAGKTVHMPPEGGLQAHSAAAWLRSCAPPHIII